MRYIIVEYSNGDFRCDKQEYLAFQNNTTDEEIDQYCTEELNCYANTYRLMTNYNNHWIKEDDENYYSKCHFNWFEINPEDDLEFDEDDWIKVS